MLIWLAGFACALQAVWGLGGALHIGSALSHHSNETSRQGRANKSPLWLPLPKAPTSLRASGFPGASGWQPPTRKWLGSFRLSVEPPKIPGDSLGLLRGLGFAHKAQSAHQGSLATTVATPPTRIGNRWKNGCGHSTERPSIRGSSAFPGDSDAFGVFSVSPGSLRAEPDLQRLATLCRSLSIAGPSCSLYGGIRGVLDYGVVGYAILENLRAALRYHFTSSPPTGSPWGQLKGSPEDAEGEELEWGDVGQGEAEQQRGQAQDLRDNVFLVETAALGPMAMWRHSGHLNLFHDEAVQCTDTGRLFRMDSLVFRPLDSAAQEKEFQVACVGDITDKLSVGKQPNSATGVAAAATATPSADAVPQENGGREGGAGAGWIPLTEAPPSLYSQLPSLVTGRRGALRPRAFSLMMEVPLKNGSFKGAKQRHSSSSAEKQQEQQAKQQQADRDANSSAILRPETAQNIFVAYKGLLPHALRSRLPFGLAQEGRAYRNEIEGTRSCFLLRLREFRQFEIEYFVLPDADKDALLAQWAEHIKRFFVSIGIPSDALEAKETPKKDLPHYASRCIDFSYVMRFRRDDGSLGESLREICGLALRGDYDLRKHQKASGESLELCQTLRSHGETKHNSTVKVLPHIIETSIGIDRLLFATLHSALTEDEVLGRKRVFLNLHPALAPYKVAVLPIVATNPEVKALARKIYNHLRKNFSVLWDPTGSLGLRYRKADELGVPFCISVDSESVQSKSARVRWRNTAVQIPLPLTKVTQFLKQRCALFVRDAG